jgi:hypothetical protein
MRPERPFVRERIEGHVRVECDVGDPEGRSVWTRPTGFGHIERSIMLVGSNRFHLSR